mmetsp:Transcript_44585/g.113940  ORF Transcript_44585/g.113940 Transcript_44585/m.113940 type:complete len:355 (-) Transcript_44585:2077-3141(-)
MLLVHARVQHDLPISNSYRPSRICDHQVDLVHPHVSEADHGLLRRGSRGSRALRRVRAAQIVSAYGCRAPFLSVPADGILGPKPAAQAAGLCCAENTHIRDGPPVPSRLARGSRLSSLHRLRLGHLFRGRVKRNRASLRKPQRSVSVAIGLTVCLQILKVPPDIRLSLGAALRRVWLYARKVLQCGSKLLCSRCASLVCVGRRQLKVLVQLGSQRLGEMHAQWVDHHLEVLHDELASRGVRPMARMQRKRGVVLRSWRRVPVGENDPVASALGGWQSAFCIMQLELPYAGLDCPRLVHLGNPCKGNPVQAAAYPWLVTILEQGQPYVCHLQTEDIFPRSRGLCCATLLLHCQLE